jgi:16S rRNA (guanine(966)-N(2))-methyltransferase RsmD
VRVIAGTLKGRRLKSPDWAGVRPTSDKLRETLFNILGPRSDGARVLDAYAGSGAVGIEALSRGAAHVTFVDHDRRATALIEANLEHCGINNRYAIIRVDFARTEAPPAGSPFDIVFLDPPYGKADLNAALERAAAMSAPGTLVIAEHAKRDAAPPQVGRLVLTRDVTSGDSGLAFYHAG